MASAAFQTETRPLRLGPVPAGQSPYVYVPFEMPEGAVELTVRLDYDHAGGDNAIDFAIFDSAFSGRDGDLTGYRGKNPNREPLISVIGPYAGVVRTRTRSDACWNVAGDVLRI